MDNEIVKSSETVESTVIKKESDFSGFSLEELRYQRAFIALQREFCKSKVISHASKLKKRGLTGYSTASGGGKMVGLVGKLITGMSYVDYAMLGLSIFSTGKKVFKFFHKKKK